METYGSNGAHGPCHGELYTENLNKIGAELEKPQHGNNRCTDIEESIPENSLSDLSENSQNRPGGELPKKQDQTQVQNMNFKDQNEQCLDDKTKMKDIFISSETVESSDLISDKAARDNQSSSAELKLPHIADKNEISIKLEPCTDNSKSEQASEIAERQLEDTLDVLPDEAVSDDQSSSNQLSSSNKVENSMQPPKTSITSEPYTEKAPFQQIPILTESSCKTARGCDSPPDKVVTDNQNSSTELSSRKAEKNDAGAWEISIKSEPCTTETQVQKTDVFKDTQINEGQKSVRTPEISMEEEASTEDAKAQQTLSSSGVLNSKSLVDYDDDDSVDSCKTEEIEAEHESIGPVNGHGTFVTETPASNTEVTVAPMDTEATRALEGDSAEMRTTGVLVDYRGDDELSSDSEDSDSDISLDLTRGKRNSICEDDHDDDEYHGPKKRENWIKTKGEFGLEDLPPIEELKITVEESVSMVHIGDVSAIVGMLVIVQGKAGMSPLNMDSVLFLENREGFGRVFETMGPVKMPFYSVRFNSTEEITSKGISVGQKIYFAPEEGQFTNYVFVNQLIKEKGSDASWEHNNEPPARYLDFSDDEEEKRVRAKQRNKNNEGDQNVSYTSAKKNKDTTDNKNNSKTHENVHNDTRRHNKRNRKRPEDMHWPPRGRDFKSNHRPPPRPKILPDGYTSTYGLQYTACPPFYQPPPMFSPPPPHNFTNQPATSCQNGFMDNRSQYSAPVNRQMPLRSNTSPSQLSAHAPPQSTSASWVPPQGGFQISHPAGHTAPPVFGQLPQRAPVSYRYPPWRLPPAKGHPGTQRYTTRPASDPTSIPPPNMGQPPPTQFNSQPPPFHPAAAPHNVTSQISYQAPYNVPPQHMYAPPPFGGPPTFSGANVPTVHNGVPPRAAPPEVGGRFANNIKYSSNG